jgi:hypothetical protein
VESGNFAECYQTLTDFDYLEAKIKRPEFGVQALITDYDLIDESKVATHSDDNSHEVANAETDSRSAASVSAYFS